MGIAAFRYRNPHRGGAFACAAFSQRKENTPDKNGFFSRRIKTGRNAPTHSLLLPKCALRPFARFAKKLRAARLDPAIPNLRACNLSQPPERNSPPPQSDRCGSNRRKGPPKTFLPSHSAPPAITIPRNRRRCAKEHRFSREKNATTTARTTRKIT